MFELYGCVSVRKETPSVVKVRSFVDPFKWWMFSPKRLADRSKDLGKMLLQLTDDIMQTTGEGNGLPWFLAFTRKDGSRWGDMQDADRLLAMGRAASMVKTHRPMTQCDIPFCVILDKEIRSIIRKANQIETENKL